MVFRGTCVRCTESIWKSWTKSTALVGTFSTSLEELMHAVLAERASLIWESLCLCLSLIRGLRERQIICQKCPIDLFRNSLSLCRATPFLVGWRKLLAAALSGHSDLYLNKSTFLVSEESLPIVWRIQSLWSGTEEKTAGLLELSQPPRELRTPCSCQTSPERHIKGVPWSSWQKRMFNPWLRGSFLLSNLAKVGVAISSAAECVRWEFATEMEED